MKLFVRVSLLCREAVGVFCSSSFLGHTTLVGGVLNLCRDAVSVFYSPTRLGNSVYVFIGIDLPNDEYLGMYVGIWQWVVEKPWLCLCMCELFVCLGA